MRGPVIEIDLLGRHVICGDPPEVVPITNIFDYFGAATEDEREAWTIVAGPMKDGHWLASGVKQSERDAVAGRTH